MRDVLEGSEEMERLLGLCFGTLFRLPVRRCAFSAKLVHGLLSRQLVTKKRFEMWPVFGGGSTRWMTKRRRRKKTMFTRTSCLGGGGDLTIEDLAGMVAGDKTMSTRKKLRICLIIIVDGVLITKTQMPKPTLKYVKLVENLNRFFSFQWGRKVFWLTISTMIPPKVLGKCDDPECLFCTKLRLESKFMVGFPRPTVVGF